MFSDMEDVADVTTLNGKLKDWFRCLVGCFDQVPYQVGRVDHNSGEEGS